MQTEPPEPAKAEDVPVFGFCNPKIIYRARRAVYAVILRGNTFAAVCNARGKYFLPGGGAQTGETSEETVLREIREELGCESVIVQRIGYATQFFYAASEGTHYRMEAVFFAATLEIPNRTMSAGDEELIWLPVGEAQTKLFHACHAWAVDTAMA